MNNHGIKSKLKEWITNFKELITVLANVRSIIHNPPIIIPKLKTGVKDFFLALWSVIKAPFSVSLKPSPRLEFFLSILLFLLMGYSYIYLSNQRHKKNIDDKLMPTLSKIFEGFRRTAFELEKNQPPIEELEPWIVDFKNKPIVKATQINTSIGKWKIDWNIAKPVRFIMTTMHCRLWTDTIASGKRFFEALAILFLAVLLGLYMGIFPCWEVIWFRFMIFFSMINPLALLPIIFILLGVGEISKISLMAIGVFPAICKDTYLKVKALPQELIVKAMTLGASNMEIAHKIAFRQIFPQVLDTIRINFQQLIVFLLVAEALAADAGIGYRIFIVRRYVAMDIIISYVIWIALLAYLLDWSVRYLIKRRYPWSTSSN